MSLDGYINDENGAFGWSRPDEELRRFMNDLDRPIGECSVGWHDRFAAGDDARLRLVGEVVFLRCSRI